MKKKLPPGQMAIKFSSGDPENLRILFDEIKSKKNFTLLKTEHFKHSSLRLTLKSEKNLNFFIDCKTNKIESFSNAIEATFFDGEYSHYDISRSTINLMDLMGDENLNKALENMGYFIFFKIKADLKIEDYIHKFPEGFNNLPTSKMSGEETEIIFEVGKGIQHILKTYEADISSHKN